MDLPQDCDSVSELCCDQCHINSFSSKLEYNLHYLAHKSVPVVSVAKLSELSVEKLKHQSYKVNNGVARRTRNLVSPLRISLKKQEGTIEFQVVKKHDRRSDHGHHGNHGHHGHHSHHSHHGHHGHYGESRKSIGFVENTGSGVTSDTLTSKKDAEGKRSHDRYASNSSVTRKGKARRSRGKRGKVKEKERQKEWEKEREREREKERQKEWEKEREREKEKEREREREKEKEREREREKEKERQREREREKERQREKEREKEREREREKEREREREKERQREKEREKERQKEKEREKERQKEKEREKEVDANGNVNRSKSSEFVQDRTVGHQVSGGVSVIKQNPSVLKLDDDKNPPKIVGAFAAVAEDANQLKKSSTVETSESDRQRLNETTILKKLSGLGFSLIPQTPNETDIEEQSTANDSAEKENRRQRVNPLNITDAEAFVRTENFLCDESNNEDSKDSESDALCIIEIPNEETNADGLPGIRKRREIPVVNGSGHQIDYTEDDTLVVTEHVRVSGSNTKGDDSGEGDEGREADDFQDPVSEKPQSIENAREVDADDAQDGEQTHTDGDAPNSNEKEFRASCLEPAASPLNHSELQFSNFGERDNRLQDPDDCTILLGSMQNGGDCDGFNSVNRVDGFRSDSFEDGNNEAELQGEEVASGYSSLPSEGSSIDDSQQDPLMSSESLSNSGETLSQSFLRSYLAESQTSQGNSEYMSLERLAQVSGLDNQHGQGYDVNPRDPATPMEQLSQQVQRLPNPTMNVMPHHHMQGLASLAPQQSGSFEALSHMQNALQPPPLYQGFNIFGQNFPAQGPQQLPPRPPILQQRPPMPRGLQNISFPRARSRCTAKRSPTRLPSSQEIPQKQRRTEVVPARTQTTIGSNTKIPSGITVTPPKNVDPSKVASVLASRGITVTPASAAPRQGSPGGRPQQKVSAVINIGSGVSVTASTNNKSGSNFAVPPPRRNSPIVNPDIERPERCTTVDLTQDDEPQSPTNRAPTFRNLCNQCSKVFPTAAALEVHKTNHRSLHLPHKCDKCSATYPNVAGLQQHRAQFHKPKPPTPELAIPIVDLNHPGAREQLSKCGISGFLPLSQLQSNSVGQFGLPILHLDTTKEKALPNTNVFGTANVLVLGKMKQLSQTQTP